MRYLFIFSFLLISFNAFSQDGVRPDQFPELTDINDDNFEFYSQKNGINTKVVPSTLKKSISAQIESVVDAPQSVGNTQNLGDFVITNTGELYYISSSGVAILINSESTIYGTYKNNDDAMSGGVPLNGRYVVAISNTMGKKPGDYTRRTY